MQISEYTETWYEYELLLTQVSDLCNEYLVEELMLMQESEQEDISDIIDRYMSSGDLSVDDRGKLVGFYILIHCEEEIWLK